MPRLLPRRIAELRIASPAGPRVIPITKPALAETPALVAMLLPI